MRIAIDARMMGPLVTRGIGRYVEELVRALAAVGPEHRYVLLCRNPESSPFQGHPSIEHVVADIPWYTFEEQMRMSKLISLTRADLAHIPHWNAPILAPRNLVITCHDLLLRHQPASAKASTRGPLVAGLKRLGYRLTLGQAMRHASSVLVPTEAVAEDVRALYPSAQDVTVTGEGLTSFPAPDLSVLSRWKLEAGSFLFYCGAAYPHKRLDLLLEAWKGIAAKHPSLQLVIAGEEDAFMARQIAHARDQNLPRVTFPGRVTDAELAAFLDHAQAFVFPTSFEGFGLPPIEALSRSCPVVASDIPVLREVLPAQGVFFFRNGDANDMMRAIDTVVRDPATARAKAASSTPLVRSNHDWNRTAERTLEAYGRVCQR